MLTKKQLEDAAECPQNGLCTKCEMDCVRTLYNGYFDGCISEAAQTALAYREMLEQLEWVYNGGAQECPWCQNSKGAGHSDDCELAALLKESEVEEEGKPPKETEKESEVVMHISSPDILTQESIDFWEKEYGIELRCDICNVRLQPGDQKDHLWPYLSDYNRCRKCLEKEKT